MKSHTKLLVSILLISAIANTTGCSKEESKYCELKDNLVIEGDKLDRDFSNIGKTNSDNLFTDISKELIEAEEDNNEITNNTDNLDIEEILRTNLYDENIDYNLIIDKYVNNYELREEFRNEYLKATYMLFINSNVKISDYLKELHTMVVMQQLPMCASEDIWNEQFKNLIALDPYCESLFDKYCDFAIYVHSLECDKKHYYNEFNSYTCDNLENEYIRKLTIHN